MDDRLVDERLRLSTAREQLETARTREEELLNELQIMHASQVVTEMGQITEGDVNDLKAAFKKDLEDVLGFVREFSQPTAAQEETAETALEESEDEEAVAENLGDFRQVVAAAVKSLSSKQLNKLLENPEATCRHAASHSRLYSSSSQQAATWYLHYLYSQSARRTLLLTPSQKRAISSSLTTDRPH